jgi:hypothetical protein
MNRSSLAFEEEEEEEEEALKSTSVWRGIKRALKHRGPSSAISNE